MTAHLQTNITTKNALYFKKFNTHI